jgi:hypothetical protein
VVEPVPPVPVQPPPQPQGVGFRNPAAVRVASGVGAICAMLIFVPFPPIVAMLWWTFLLVTGGFLAAYFYYRRTKAPSTVRGGAAVGSMAGLFCFVIVFVLFTLNMAALSVGEGLQSSIQNTMAHGQNPEVQRQITEWLSSPEGLGMLLVVIITSLFLMLTVLPAIGGALAAKVLEKN